MVFETVQSTVEIALVVQRSELCEVVACVSSIKMRLFQFFEILSSFLENIPLILITLGSVVQVRKCWSDFFDFPWFNF